MKIGIDLDNTIAIYDCVFSKLAQNLKNIPKEVAGQKKLLADFLRNNNREKEWTYLQGLAYGPFMKEATIASNFEIAMQLFMERNIDVTIVSHRSKYPASGANFDLHFAAKKWLDLNCPAIKSIFFEETLENKINRIHSQNLDFFIDDLEHVLNSLKMQQGKKIMYCQKPVNSTYSPVLSNWADIMQFLG